MNTQGQIYRESIYHVACAVCEEDFSTADAGTLDMTHAKAAAIFRENGWHYRKGEGWICPGCFEKKEPA